MDINIILWLGGMLFSLSIFAMKVGFALGFGGLKWKGILLTLSLYLVLFVLMSAFSGLLKDVLEPVLSKGLYLHGLMAAGMILWGILLLKTQDADFEIKTGSRLEIQESNIKNAQNLTYKSSLPLLIPCPVCLSAMAFSTWAALGVIKLPAVLVGLGVGFVFIVLSLAFYFSLKHFTRYSSIPPKNGLGLSMIAIGLYFIGSFYVPAKIEEAKIAYKAFSENQATVDMTQAFGLLLLFLAVFAAGFIFNINKEDIS